MLPGGAKRRPSFKMVSNMVIQLLHSIKYSVEVPFSNMAQQPVDIQKGTLASSNNPNKKVRTKQNKQKQKHFILFLELL
jgi:adenylate cyclase 1